MSKTLVVISHSFRINSRILREAMKNREVTVVYASPWYFDKEEMKVIKSGDQSFHRRAINFFASELLLKLGLPLYLIRDKSPGNVIHEIISKNNISKVYYDMPLFGNSSWIEFKEKPIVIDSDSYDPFCSKMTAKSRWVYWSKNRNQKPFIPKGSFKSLDLNLPVLSINKEEYFLLKNEIEKVNTRLSDIIPNYHVTRNHKEGSTLLSKYLHHGLIDGCELVSDILEICPEFLNNDNELVPLLRQLAFREICIRKARIHGLKLTEDVESWASRLLDKKSLSNLKREFPGRFTPEQFISGQTGDKLIDNTISILIKEKWLPNRIRMWLASQSYYGIGGGMNSLLTLIKLFNMYSDDGQSPNNYVSCVESMRMQYGKVMNYNTIKSFNLAGM